MRTRWTVLVGMLAVALAVTAVGTRAGPMPDVTLTWGEDFELRTLDPRVASSRHDVQVFFQVFESLVYRDNDGKIYPWLAESWQVSPDGTSITFKLRRGVKFHDGTPFDAEAVKFTFDSIKDPATKSQGATDLLGPYKGSDIIDSHTIRVNWSRPFAAALTNQSSGYLGIVSPAAVKKLGNAGFARNPVGTGPFKFVEWVPRVRVVLERFDDYNWAPAFFKHKGPSRIKRVVIRMILDNSTRVAALEKGEIDVADLVPPIEVRRFQGSKDFDVVIGRVSGLPQSYHFNTARTPTSDLRVRQAFMYAVNRPRVIQQVFFGVSQNAWAPLAPTTVGYWAGAEKVYQYDPAKARALLEEAGWKVGAGGVRMKGNQPLEMFLPVLIEPELAIAIQAAVKEVGIKVNVEAVTKSKSDELIIKNDYHVMDLRWVTIDPSVLSVAFHSRNVPTPAGLKFNFSRHESPQLDKMLVEADATVDPAARGRILADIQKYILDNALALPLHVSFQPVGFKKSVQGLRFAPGFWHVLFYEATITK